MSGSVSCEELVAVGCGHRQRVIMVERTDEMSDGDVLLAAADAAFTEDGRDPHRRRKTYDAFAAHSNEQHGVSGPADDEEEEREPRKTILWNNEGDE